jgi:Cu2+-exporting ATPase
MARHGVLTTRGHALETLTRANHFVFDKTGTLTRGELRLRRAEITLLTGDQTAAAQHMARVLGIDRVRAELSSGEKLGVVQQIQAEGAVVAVVGDGVNDAPILAAAPVSIAMGSAAAVSAAAADMLLLAQDLRPIAAVLDIARRATAIIRQNLAWAIGYNLLAVPAAAGGFVAPWMAALGMSASSALVVANALRLTRTKKMEPQMNADRKDSPLD